MPNRRSRRRKNKKYKYISKSTPSDEENLMALFNETAPNDSKEFKKFIAYVRERKLCGPEKTNEFVIFCLSSYFILGEKYRKLPLMYKLIPLELLQEEALSDFKFPAGVSDQVLQLLKLKTENYDPCTKVVVLVIDESTVRPSATFCLKYECEVGYVDNGKVKSNALAQFVTNIWMHCVGGQWVIPFGFIFTENSISASEIKDFLFESVTKLDTIGLDVVGVITKMRPNFYELSNELNISPANQTFKVGTKELIFLYDVPQLMNITRNNMMKYKFKFNGMQTSWKDVKNLYALDIQGERKTKLTPHHLKPDSKVRVCYKYALEVLSKSVATEMKAWISLGKLPQSAAGTAECIDMFDKLFDILNSEFETCSNEFNSSFKGTKDQNMFIEKMIEFFENLKVFDSKNEDCTDTIKFIKGWLITIKSFMKLWDIVKAKGYSYLLTRNINCESLDQFTAIMHTTALFFYSKPTVSEFLDTYATYFNSSYFTFENLPDVKEVDLQEFVEKVYKRIPSTKTVHEDEESQQDTNDEMESSIVLDIFDDFLNDCISLSD